MIADHIDVVIDRLVVDGLDPAEVAALAPLVAEELRRLVGTGGALWAWTPSGLEARELSADEAADPPAVARAIAGQIASSLPEDRT